MNSIINQLYAYCTDFIINLANLSGLSYYEVNFFIFCLLYPLLLVLCPLWYIRQRAVLRKAVAERRLSDKS